MFPRSTGVPGVLGDQARSEEKEEGRGEAEESPGHHVTGVVLVVRHPGDGDPHRVHHHQHLHSQFFYQSNCERTEVETFI